MLYDLKKNIDRKKAQLRFDHLMEKQYKIELKRRGKRTLNQNSYIHLLFGIFAADSGDDMEYVKQEVFKRECNPDIFLTQIDGVVGKKECLKSSKDIEIPEMAKAITRFRDWSSATQGIYLPSADEQDMLEQAEMELSRNHYI